MQPNQANAPMPSGGFDVRDTIFVIFKHKWKIATLTVIGLAAAAALYAGRTPVYGSQTKLLVRYVLERRAIDDPNGTNGGMGGRGGAHIVNAEIEILNSADLALDVAGKIGPERLVAEGNEPNLLAAAGAIRRGLEVTAGRGSNVIHVSFHHPNPEMANVVLSGLIQSYFEKHLEIHRELGASDYVTRQADQARARLRETEAALNRIKKESGVLSLTGSTDALESNFGRVREALMAAETELIEQSVRLSALGGLVGTDEEKDAGLPDGEVAAAGSVMESMSDTAMIQAAREEYVIASAEYGDISNRLGFLRQRRNELLARYTPTNPLVASTQRQILEAETQRRTLLNRFPALISENGTSSENGQPSTDVTVERARLSAVQARADSLRAQEANIKEQMENLAAISGEIIALERRKALDEENYRYLESSLERARADASLDPSKMPNITVIQHPTPSGRTFEKATMNVIYGLASGGFALGVGLAFLIELVIDPRVKRPGEIRTRLQMPLIMTIPHVRTKRRERVLELGSSTMPRLGNSEEGWKPAVDGSQLGTSESTYFLKTYAEALRDRIIFNFGINNVTHKPKVIGLTGLSGGAGTSSIAAGIAKAFAEAPGVKVLFVDLDSSQSSANPIFGAARPLSLPGALQVSREQEFRETNMNLVYASAAAGPKGIVPLQIQELMPYLRFSDFDYIVFDMPPISQTSPTIAMAGLMDKVLLILDADNTCRDKLKWGYSELVSVKADVSCVFNKARAHAPKWVLGER
jgi:uncharacterized protein involved in exopolysaccharide biosynthesis